jgi:hypothetical protein
MSSIKKPYCKVCHDSGKPESEYTNHWVKDLNGKTTCPTLLNTECRYCFKRGHTAKFCSVLTKNNLTKNNLIKNNKENNKTIMNKPKPFQNKPTNGFAVLCNDDDEEEITNIVFGIENSREEQKTTWASITAKPATHSFEESKQVKPQAKSWADWSDSEDEEDFEDDEEYFQEIEQQYIW